MTPVRVLGGPAGAGIAAALCLALPAMSNAQSQAEAMVFDETFLHRNRNQQGADLSVFAFSNRVLPGVRSVVLQLNGQTLGMREIEFVEGSAHEDAQPCLSVSALRELGVKVQAFPGLEQLQDADCARTLGHIPAARVTYDQDKNVMNLSIPQAALDRKARGVVPAHLWDPGTTALWSSYRLSYNRSSFSSMQGRHTNDTYYASFRNGLNLGAWRLRGNGTYYDNGYDTGWDWTDLYMERDIAAWRGRLRMGDSTTPGNVFTSVRFRGAQIQSDDGMLPDSQRGYAPVVRGVAAGNAKVTVRQQGHAIYTTFVPAGPFEIDDLYSTPGGGDLEVEIEELGGRTTRYFQPFSALPAMLREGIWNYSAMVGEHRHNYDTNRPLMGQVTLAYGLPYGLTGYGGWTSAQGGYHAGALGVAANLRALGALSVDVTSSRSRSLAGNTLTGSAARVQYSKFFPGTGTDFTLASYRYHSGGYRSLDDAIRERAGKREHHGFDREHEYQLSVSQRLDRYGSISLSYYGIAYRNPSGNATYAQLGYSSSIGRVGYSLNYAISRSPWQSRESTVMLSLNIPLGGSHSASYTMNRTRSDGISHGVSLNGAMLDDYSLTYALQAGSGRGDNGHSGATGYGAIGYASSVGTANLSHAYSRDTSNTYADFSGAILLDGKGVLLGQSLGETAIIVEAPGAAGVGVDARPGVRTNAEGRALIPYANPYRENRISLASDYQNDDAYLKQTVQTVVPTRGAIVVAKFDTEIGRTVLIVLRDAAGMELPFGAIVYADDGEQRGIVGPVGRVWLTGLEGTRRFSVRWGASGAEQCSFEIDASTLGDAAGRTGKEVRCVGS